VGAGARPAVMGLVHGLAGSAGIALLTATTIGPPILAAAHLMLFGLGTVLGMVVLTVVLSKPISWTVRREGPLKTTVTLVAALLSMALGVAVVARCLCCQGTP
jgi:nickel/cobalt exporter